MERVKILQLLLVTSLLVTIMSRSCVLGFNVPSIFIFGDSIFDAGNNHYNKNCTAQADFPPYGSNFFHRPTGRFTNGRTVADFVCKFFLLPHQKKKRRKNLKDVRYLSNVMSHTSFVSIQMSSFEILKNLCLTVLFFFFYVF